MPVITLEDSQANTMSNFESLNLNSWKRPVIDNQIVEDINLFNYFESPNQDNVPSHYYHSMLRDDQRPKVSTRGSSHCYEEVYFEPPQPELSDFGHGTQLMLSANNKYVLESNKWTGNQCLFEKSFDGDSCEFRSLRRDFKAQGDLKKVEDALSTNEFLIIRRPINIMVSGSSIIYDSQSKDQRLLNIDLRMMGGSPEEITNQPWSYREISEGRRIIKVEREQHGCTLRVRFRVIKESERLNQEEAANDLLSYLEVSCIRFVHNDGVTTNYFITSVDVIKIVEFLIVNNQLNSALKWRERGRIRSNLAPLWFKNWTELGPMHLPFEKRIRRFHSRSPPKMLKYVRLLLWVNLGYALSKALLFYCVCMPISSSSCLDQDVNTI